MRPDIVVPPDPFICDDADLVQVIKEIFVQNALAIILVKSFDITVLRRLSRLNEDEAYPQALSPLL